MGLVVSQIALLAHCGAKWWLCDVGSAVGFLIFVAGTVFGLKRLEKRTQARADAYRAAQAARARSALADDEVGERR